jgi:hypothetical protein
MGFYLLASARLMLSNPIAICATTWSVALARFEDFGVNIAA